MEQLRCFIPIQLRCTLIKLPHRLLLNFNRDYFTCAFSPVNSFTASRITSPRLRSTWPVKASSRKSKPRIFRPHLRRKCWTNWLHCMSAAAGNPDTFIGLLPITIPRRKSICRKRDFRIIKYPADRLPLRSIHPRGTFRRRPRVTKSALRESKAR